jgi:hypothetical protein
MSQQIGPETTVGALLEAYPELERVLMEMAPAFAKLRNPVVRRTVAKVAGGQTRWNQSPGYDFSAPQ